jgi:integrase
MTRRRQKNLGLPGRVYIKNNAYQFLSAEKIRDPADGKMKFWIRLAGVGQGEGNGEAAMLSALGKLLGERRTNKAGVPYLCQEFRAHKLGKYSQDTQDSYRSYLAKIADDFEEFDVKDVMTRHWSEFLRNHYAGKANSARKITALARKLFRYAISEFGLRQDNPIDQIDLDSYQTERRECIPTHAQVAAIRAAAMTGGDGRKTLSGPTLACIIDISYLCWQRAKEFRLLEHSQIDGGRIRFKPTKTERSSGLSVDIAITPEIQAVLDRAAAIKLAHGIESKYVFCKLTLKHQGQPYSKNGLFSMWDRARERAGIKEDVQFRDLRALAATDAAKAGRTKKEIQDRLVHTSSSTTDIYIKESVPALSEFITRLPW